MPKTNSPEYTYEYHWGRIVLTGGLIAILGIAVAYWLLSDKPAAKAPVPELATHPEILQPTNLAELQTESPTKPQSGQKAEHKSEPQTVSEPAIEDIAGSDNPVAKSAEKSAEPVATNTADIAVADVDQATVDQATVVADSPSEVTAPPAATDTRTKAELFTAAIKRAKLTTRVEQLEPGKELPADYQGNPASLSKVYFYTEVLGQAGKTHTHRWYHNGKLAAKVPITIGSDRWRCYSSKYLTPKQAGDWEVQVTDAKGRLLAKSQFHFSGSD